LQTSKIDFGVLFVFFRVHVANNMSDMTYCQPVYFISLIDIDMGMMGLNPPAGKGFERRLACQGVSSSFHFAVSRAWSEAESEGWSGRDLPAGFLAGDLPASGWI
jgi:hypothetical protein